MNLNRREFLMLMGAAGLASCSRPAPPLKSGNLFFGGGQYKLAPDAPMNYVLSVIDLSQARRELAPMSFLPHGVHGHPQQRNRLALFEKKGPGACEYDLAEKKIIRPIPGVENRYFYGHGTYTADGATLLSTEANRDSLDGAIGIRDSRDLKYLGAFPTYGQSPHECKLIDGGRTLVVTNGGGDLQGARPSVTYIDVQSQKLLDRLYFDNPKVNAGHLGIRQDGGLIVVSAPRAGLEQNGIGGISMRGADAQLQSLSQPQEIVSQMWGESLSIAIQNAAGIAAVTHPEGNMLTFWSLSDRQLLKSLSLHRPRGVALTDDREAFIVSAGEQSSLLRVPVKTLAVESRALIEQSYMTGSHIYNAAHNMSELTVPRLAA